MAGCLGTGLCVHSCSVVAESAHISPLRLSNTCTLNIVRRAIPKFQRLQPEEIPFFSPGACVGNFV